MDQRVGQTTDHFLLCGYGRVGREIALELRRDGAPFVVIDSSPDALRRAAQDGFAVVEGNAADDDVLERAGIRRARGLITALPDDADNIFATLSARALRPTLAHDFRSQGPGAGPLVARRFS